MEASAAQAPVPVRLVTPSPQSDAPVAPREEARAEAPPLEAVAAPPVEAAQPASPHRISGTTLAALAAVAGLAAIALGLWAFASSVRERSTVEIIRSAPINSAAQAISLLSKPSTQRIPLRSSGGAATLAVTKSGRGVLVLDGLAIAPIGLTYQAWVVDPRKRPFEHIEAATFSGVETVVPLTARVPPGWVLGVTVEKAGGVDEPSRAFRFGAQRPR
jgi:Anti-sigma-K factor rskA